MIHYVIELNWLLLSADWFIIVSWFSIKLIHQLLFCYLILKKMKCCEWAKRTNFASEAKQIHHHLLDNFLLLDLWPFVAKINLCSSLNDTAWTLLIHCFQLNDSASIKIHYAVHLMHLKLSFSIVLSRMILLKWSCSIHLSQITLLRWLCFIDPVKLIMLCWASSDDPALMTFYISCFFGSAHLILLVWI